MKRLRIGPGAALSGTLRVPGDLHIGQQALVWAALSSGECLIAGLSGRSDHRLLCDALRALGVPIADTPAGVRVAGVGLRGLKLPRGALQAGDSVTTLEILTALMAGQQVGTRIEASGAALGHSLRTLIAPLRARGAHVAGRSDDRGDSHAPVAVAPLLADEPLREVEIEIPDGDPATKLGLLLSGLYARGVTAIQEGMLSRDHAERALLALGANLETLGAMTLLDTGDAPPAWSGFEWEVPGDFTLACWVIAAALSVPGSDVRIEGVGLNRSRCAFLDVMRHAGARIDVLPKGDVAGNEPVGDLRVRSSRLRSVRVAGELAFRMRDEVGALAALASCAAGRISVRDMAALRGHRPDPLRSLAQVLRGAGLECTEYDDGFDVDPGTARVPPSSGQRDPGGLVLACVLALSGEHETLLDHAEHMDALYPGFGEALAALGARITQEEVP